MKEFDAIIIGAGQAGPALAGRLARRRSSRKMFSDFLSTYL